jgi:hypothetical protein
MSITTYAELQTAVANYLARSDLTAYIPDFISLAEATFQRDLRHRRMVAVLNLSTSASTATVALPSDFIEARSMILQSAPNVILDYKTTNQLATDFPDDSVTGKPTEYAIVGSNIRLGKIPDAVYTIEIEYYQRIPVLSVSNTTNWVLTYYPDAYLFGALLQAQPFIKDDARINIWATFLTRTMEGIGLEANRTMWAGGPLSASVDIQVS